MLILYMSNEKIVKKISFWLKLTRIMYELVRCIILDVTF